MASSKEQNEVTLRCRRCRSVLLVQESNRTADECCKTFAQLRPIWDDQNTEDSQMPEWMMAALNKNDWRTGKLSCPVCSGKVGSFNFISPQKCSCGRQQAPPVYLYKSRIDICATTDSFVLKEDTTMDSSRQRDHFAVLKKSASDEEWMVIFASKPTDSISSSAMSSSKTANVKAHRKSKSWHASGSTVSNWLTSTLSDVSSHLELAANETKQALADTLDMANSVVAAPVSSAIRKGHRKTKSWSGSIKTTISSLLGGIFSNSRDSSNANGQQRIRLQPISSSPTLVDNIERSTVEKRVAETKPTATSDPFLNSLSDHSAEIPSRKKKPQRASREPKRSCKQLRTRSKSTTGIVSIIPDYLLCAICLDIFCLPRFCLPCRHAFCEPCLKLLANTVPLSGNRLRTLCPLCRQLIRWTEPAKDLVAKITESGFCGRYKKRILEFKMQLSVRTLKLPGIYHMKWVRQIVSGLPEGVARYLETFWVDYTPLVTLYSFCVSLLCLLFFFTLFLPCVYLTSWICKFFENFPSFDELGASLVYQEVLDFGALVIGSGILSLASVIVIVSIALYTLFVM